jgi:hypothetical protein
MRALSVMRGLMSVVVVLVGPCLLGCGGAVDSKYRPAQKIEKWDNTEWARVLEVVATEDGYVRHDLLKENRQGVRDALFRYVGMINAAGPENRPELFPTQNDRLAYYSNAYNAVCMYLVVKRNFPSNMKTSGIFFFDKVPVGGKDMTLDFLEKTYLRPFDPRIHFAINCMSTSCPPLRREPYEAATLDAQYDEQGRLFLSDPRGAYLDGGTAVISEIFRFFTGDFTEPYAKQTGRTDVNILEAIRPFADDDSPVKRATASRFQDYDWSLNRPPGQ